MTDTTKAQEQTRDQVVADAVEETHQAEKDLQVDPAEAEARKLGWRPEEDWTGDTENWLTRDKFMERNKRLADRGDKILKAEVGKLTRANQDLTKTVQDLGAHLTKADQRAYVKAAKDLQTQADRAAREGDTEAYDRARDDIKELETDAKTEAQTKVGVAAQKPQTRPDDPEFDAWLPDNAWYDPKDAGFDVDMAAYADSIAPSVGRMGLIGAPYYDRIATEVKKKFDKGNSQRQRAPAVEGGGGGRSGNEKTLWSQVPKDDQGVFKRFVSQGLYEDTKEGREQYADIYLNG